MDKAVRRREGREGKGGEMSRGLRIDRRRGIVDVDVKRTLSEEEGRVRKWVWE